MKRRDFITLLGGSLAFWPTAARAQQRGKQPTIGYLGANSASAQSDWTAAFVQGLREVGWVEGQNVTMQYRWANGAGERYNEIAAEFVRLKVDVIVSAGNEASAAAKQATSVIPIVFPVAGDPIGTGLVASLAHPGGNATGISIQQTDLVSKRLELLREVVPGLRRLALLANANSPNSVKEMREVQAISDALGLELSTYGIRRADDIAPAFEGTQGPCRRALCQRRPAREYQPRSHKRFGAGGANTDDVRLSRACRSGRSLVIWPELCGLVPTRSRSCR